MKNLVKLCSATVLTLSLAACGSGGSDSAPKPAAAPAPAPAAPAPVTAAAAPALPAECDAYIARVNTCVDKISAGNPAAATFKQQMEASKAQWAAVPDKTALANICKQANDAFNQSAQMLKCE
jgi:hypothetical protein